MSGILAAFAGGYIAARMSGKTAATTGALHGLTTWAFTTLLVLYLLSTAVGSIVGGAFGVTSAVGGLGQTVAQTAAAGASDRLIDTAKQSARLHEAIGHSSFHAVAGAGHMVHQTATRAVMAAIDEAAAAKEGRSELAAAE